MTRSAPPTRGFTLAEILIATAVMTLVMVIVLRYTADVASFGIDLGDRIEVERELELTLRVLVTEIRSMGPGENGAFPIALAASDSLTFYTDVDNDQTFEQVRYFLAGTTLRKGVIEPVGIDQPVYPPADEQVTDVVHFMVPGQTIFTYFAEGYPDSIGPLPSPVNPSLVRMIRATGVTDKDTSLPPLPFTLSVSATIRNLRGEI
jgi:prepilin-type N-terminal cleavage/methylation domain-containing protein